MENLPQKLYLTIIQEQDAAVVCEVLHKEGYEVNLLPSTGGFLGNKNITLLIYQNTPGLKDVVQILDLYCHPRIDYVSVHMEGTMWMTGPHMMPVTVGGATLFGLEVEQVMVV